MHGFWQEQPVSCNSWAGIKRDLRGVKSPRVTTLPGMNLGHGEELLLWSVSPDQAKQLHCPSYKPRNIPNI